MTDNIRSADSLVPDKQIDGPDENSNEVSLISNLINHLIFCSHRISHRPFGCHKSFERKPTLKKCKIFIKDTKIISKNLQF